MKKYLMVAAILAVGTTVLAEGKIGGTKLEETVITTENFETTIKETPKNITIVTSEEIKNKGANTVAEALKGVPGVTVRYMDGSEPSFDLRGFGATATKNTIVLIDGIPLNSIQGTGYDTNQIPVDMIARIEVIPSGGAVMYGDGAAGGIINIITKNPQNKENYGNLGLEAGSWGTTKGNIHYGTKVNDRLLMDVAYINYRSEGYRSRSKSEYNKDDTKESVWLRGKYILDNGSIEANYRYNETEDYYTGSLKKKQFDQDPSLPGTFDGLSQMKENSYSLKYLQSLNEKIDFLIYGGYDEREYEGSSTHYIASQYYIKPQLKYTYAEKSYLILGGDYKDGKSEDKSNKPAKDKKRESYAGYIMNKTTYGNWQFTQGIRAEKIEYEAEIKKGYNKPVTGKAKDHSAVSYELGANYFYSETGNVYLSYVNGITSPTITDLGAWSGDIKVQENETYELGVKDIIGNTNISSSIFLINTDKEIFYDKPDFENRTNKNFDGEVERKGIQISLQHYFNKLTLRENITYIDAKVKSGKYDGKEFPGISNWTVNLGATYDFTEKLLGNIDLYYQSDIYAEDDFDNYFSKENNYTTVDTNVRYRFDSGLELYAGIRNLFDESYANTIISSKDTKDWKGRPIIPGKAYYPADGRSYYAGFRYSF